MVFPWKLDLPCWLLVIDFIQPVDEPPAGLIRDGIRPVDAMVFPG
jgi:hypothetical protein